MANQKRSVMILFNGLTTNNKVYAKGEIEDNPNDWNRHYIFQLCRK